MMNAKYTIIVGVLAVVFGAVHVDCSGISRFVNRSDQTIIVKCINHKQCKLLWKKTLNKGGGSVEVKEHENQSCWKGTCFFEIQREETSIDVSLRKIFCPDNDKQWLYALVFENAAMGILPTSLYGFNDPSGDAFCTIIIDISGSICVRKDKNCAKKTQHKNSIVNDINYIQKEIKLFYND